MNLSLSRKIEDVGGGEIFYNIFRWPYMYQIVYEDNSVVLSLRTLEEARKYGNLEEERRQDIVMNKLKGD